MAVVVVRYINPATEQSFILAQAADGDANTLHGAFEEYLVDGWTTEIISYLPCENAVNYHDYAELERREERAHKEGGIRWD
jgi:hypothetical protein